MKRSVYKLACVLGCIGGVEMKESWWEGEAQREGTQTEEETKRKTETNHEKERQRQTK